MARLLLACALTVVGAATQAESFTVRDSIERTIADREYFNSSTQRLDQRAFSPDGRKFFLVTSRGNVERNWYETTLWLYEIDAVRRYVGLKEPALPIGRKLATRYSRAHLFAIRSVAWLGDSRHLMFVADDANDGGPDIANGRLQIVNLDDGTHRNLAPSTRTVVSYSAQGSSVVYSAESSDDEALHAERLRRLPGVALTDETLSYALDPADRNADSDRAFDTLVRRLDGVGEVPIQEPRYNQSPFYLGLSVSPGSQWAIATKPVRGIPTHWQDYVVPEYREIWLSQARGADPGSSARYSVAMLQIVLIDLLTGQVTQRLDAPSRVANAESMVNALWSSDERRVIVAGTYLSLAEPGLSAAERSIRAKTRYLVAMDARTGVVTPIRPMKNCSAAVRCEEVARLAWGRNSSTLLVEIGDTDGSVHEESYVFRRTAWALTGKRALTRERSSQPVEIRLHEDAGTPPDVWADEIESGKTMRVTQLNPQFGAFGLNAHEDLQWRDEHGDVWRGGLLLPDGYVPGRRYPLVIQTHGYRPQQFLIDGPATTGFAARAIAARGIAVVQMGETSRPAEILSTPEEAPSYLRGYEALVKALGTRGLIDPRRVGLSGWSHTCFHVKYALAYSSMPFAAASAADGVDYGYLNLLYFYGLEPGWREFVTPYGGPPVGKHLHAWIQSAPHFSVDKISTPLRIETATKYMLIRDWEMYALLKMAGKPVELIYFPEGSHDMIMPLQRMTSQQGNVDWFDFWLNGHEDPDQARAEQYARWRKLRDRYVVGHGSFTPR